MLRGRKYQFLDSSHHHKLNDWDTPTRGMFTAWKDGTVKCAMDHPRPGTVPSWSHASPHQVSTETGVQEFAIYRLAKFKATIMGFKIWIVCNEYKDKLIIKIIYIYFI